MRQSIAHVALVVRDYDEAIAFYCGALGFRLVADEHQPAQGKRWVLVAPAGAPEGGATLLLARASDEHQQRYVGDQSGGRVFLFLQTDDFDRDYAAMRAKDVQFIRPPAETDYGKAAVFLDLYGNKWDLIQRKSSAASGL